MTLIQIKLINGVPMGRPCNPFEIPIERHQVTDWDVFEQSVTEHEATGCEEGEAEGELVWQEQSPISKIWRNVSDDSDSKYSKRQIWIAPTPEKVEVKEVENWIRVEDRLPKLGDRVLLKERHGSNIVIGHLCEAGTSFNWKTDIHYNVNFASHWQPLPLPPTH